MRLKADVCAFTFFLLWIFYFEASLARKAISQAILNTYILQDAPSVGVEAYRRGESGHEVLRSGAPLEPEHILFIKSGDIASIHCGFDIVKQIDSTNVREVRDICKTEFPPPSTTRGEKLCSFEFDLLPTQVSEVGEIPYILSPRRTSIATNDSFIISWNNVGSEISYTVELWDISRKERVRVVAEGITNNFIEYAPELQDYSSQISTTRYAFLIKASNGRNSGEENLEDAYEFIRSHENQDVRDDILLFSSIGDQNLIGFRPLEESALRVFRQREQEYRSRTFQSERSRLWNLVSLYIRQCMYHDAITTLTTSELSQASITLQYWLGSLYSHIGALPEAIESYEELLALFDSELGTSTLRELEAIDFPFVIPMRSRLLLVRLNALIGNFDAATKYLEESKANLIYFEGREEHASFNDEIDYLSYLLGV